MLALEEYIDHTLLKPTATAKQIEQLCQEALSYSFKAVCVNPAQIGLTHSILKNTSVKIASVVGFPLGASDTRSKECETESCIEAGADELDMVLNLGWMKDQNYAAIEEELRRVREKSGSKTLKLILETCYLSPSEIVSACELAVACGIDFVKTSTGFGTDGATIDHVSLMKATVGDRAQVKASGGIRDLDTALKMIDAGASRLGTSSGVVIIEAFKKNSL